MRSQNVEDLVERRLDRVLRRQAEHIGDQVWLADQDREITFAETDELVDRYANGLAELGVGKGDPVAMFMHPSAEVVLLGLAAARLGAVFATINTDFRGEFLREALDATRADVLVVDSTLQEAVTRVGDMWRGKHLLVNGVIHDESGGARPSESLRNSDHRAPHVDTSYSDVVQIWWSSATTGKAKGIMQTHSGLLIAVDEDGQNFTANEKVRDGDTLYSCTPMYLGSPWVGTVWRSLRYGVRAAIDPQFSVSRFWERTRHYGATHFFTLGAMHMHLLAAPERPDDADNPIRVAICVPLTHDLVPVFKRRFGVESMPQAYGTSETFVVFGAPDDGTPWQKRTIGRTLDRRYEVKLFDEDDREVPVGAVGEICVRPKQAFMTFAGYFEQPQRTNDTWRNLWHHTGDMAVVDDDGQYFFADRKQDYIRYKGRNITMFEVESVVRRHPDVDDVAAFGVTSAELETEAELMVSVVRRPGSDLTAEELARFVNDNAPYFFVPRYVEFIDVLPRNAHGRVMKHVIRDTSAERDEVWDRDSAGFEVTRG